MKWWLVLALVLPFAQQPTEMPKDEGATKANRAQDTGHAKSTDNNQQPSAPTPIAQLSSNTGSKTGTTNANTITGTNSEQTPDESLDIQRKLTRFTGGLLAVGFLQAIALFGQVYIYCRQAKIMTRQAREMKRQRGYMRLQWKSMGEQSGLMTEQLDEMKESRKIETKTLILQYRPKIIVRLAKASDFNVAELGKPAKGKIEFSIINTGGSPAHVSGGNVAVWSAVVSAYPTDIKEGDKGLIEQFTLQPGEEKRFEGTLGTGVSNDLNWADFYQARQTEPKRCMWLVGVIFYTDDLEIPRRTGIYRNYDVKYRTFEPSKSEGEYAD